jgi:hypothetical protein
MLLSFDKPKKLRPTEQHNSNFSSDSGIAGTYVPNMSQKDMERWKAKHISRGDDPRVEIRKTVGGTQLLMVVRPDKTVRLSMNGPATMSAKILAEFNTAAQEAFSVLDQSND